MSRMIKVRNILIMIGIPLMIIMIVASCFLPNESESDNLPDLENFKIEDVAEEQILNVPSCIKCVMSSEHAKGESTGVKTEDSRYSDYDKDSYVFSARKVVGIRTINATRIENNTLTLDIKSSIGEGKGKIVVIKDNEIIETFAVGENKVLTYEVEEKHIFYVKVLLENAKKFEVELTRSING